MKFIFVGGAPRSGTTLVQKVLLAHEAINGGPEFHFTRRIFDLYRDMDKAIYDDVIGHLLDSHSLQRSFVEFYESVFQLYDRCGIEYISEKTPTNIFVADILLRVFPESCFVNIYRDGRAVLASHFAVKKRAYERNVNLTEINSINTSRFWNESIECYLELKKNHDISDRLHSICYEEMIVEPEKVFTELFEFLGLQPHEAIVKPENIRLSDQQKHDANINGVWYTQDMYHRSYDTLRIDGWKTELHPISRWLANIIMYKHLEVMGYEVNKHYHLLNKVYMWFYYIKPNIKKMKVVQPILKLKRKLI